MAFSWVSLCFLFTTPLVYAITFMKTGDVEIHVVMAITETSDQYSCTQKRTSVSDVEIAQSFDYVTRDINTNHTILADVNLGFAVYDTCGHQSWTRGVTDIILRRIISKTQTIYPPAIVMFPTYLPYANEVKAVMDRHNILNIELDFWGAKLSPTPSNFQIPRSITVLPNQFVYTSPQILVTEAMKDLLRHYNWTYVSILSIETATNFMIEDKLETELKSAGICIANYVKIHAKTTSQDVYIYAIRQIAQHSNAKVVLTFLDDEKAIALAETFDKVDVGPTHSGDLIWVTFGLSKTALTVLAKSGMVINLRKIRNTLNLRREIIGSNFSAFKKYYSSLTMKNNSKNPWFRKALEAYNDCTLKSGLFNLPCEEKDHPVNLETRPLDVYYSTVQEVVYDYAEALDEALKRSCVTSNKNNTENTTSTSQPDVMECLKTVNKLQFYYNLRALHKDQNRFFLEQVFANSTTTNFGSWKGRLYITEEPYWKVLKSLSNGRLDDTPLSVCSLPCAQGKRPSFVSSVRCCWVCV